MATKPAASKKKSDAIKGDLEILRLTARVGQIVIVPDDVEWINPTTKRKVPGITLDFGDNGVCELHPKLDADKIAAYQEWIEEGRDPRIAETGVFEIAKDALLPPFPAWDITDDGKCLEMVETLGYDAEMCLRYELQRGDKARPKIVKGLGAKVDEPPADDPLSEPEL